MSIMAEAQRLAREGKTAEGVALVEQAADSGNGEALLALANWRLWGIYGPRDLQATHRLLELAESAGLSAATKLRAILIGNGTGVPANPAAARVMLEPLAANDPGIARQLSLVGAMPTAPVYEAETLSADPEIRMLRNFLADREIEYLIDAAQPSMRPSMILDPATGRPGPHPFRTSSSMNFDPLQEDLVVHAINCRIAHATGTDVAAGEPLHILRYEPGQEFRPHLDAIDKASNQRQWTALIYLNEGFEGGDTIFPEIGITTIGSRGDCLIFRVCNDDGLADRRMLHAGLPVTQGVKWLASRWIRQQPYTAEIAHP